MVDRELLEQAAKAAGIDVKFAIGKFAKHESLGLFFVDYGTSNQRSWNPLADDGDALRLAVKLRMLVQIRDTVTFVTDDDGKQLSYRPHKPHNGDPYAATRRAIVRAAAEIGKEMK